jgi:hypothetical protein
MFLLLLCLGTILALTCPMSCQPSCSPPPSSGSVGVAWFHPFSRSTTAPTRSCAAALVLHYQSQDEVVAISSLRLARQQTPCLAARVTAADRRARTQAVLLQPSGSFSDPLVSSPSSSVAPPREGPRTVFLLSNEVFSCPGPAASSQPPKKRYPSR